MQRSVAYVLGTESSGKTDLVRQLECLNNGELRRTPAKCTPTTGQEMTQLTFTLPRNERSTIEIRELGGSVVNMWERFIASRKAQDTPEKRTYYCLIFVVDATAPHQLPLASAVYRALKFGHEAVCAGWKSLIVLQKCASLNAMSKEEVCSFFVGDTCKSLDFIMEVDSWNGVGIGDILKRLKGAAVKD